MVVRWPENVDKAPLLPQQLAPSLAQNPQSAKLLDRGSSVVEQDPSLDSEQLFAADLAARIAQGDATAEHELVVRYGRGLRCLLWQITKNVELAADLYQETFLLVLEKLRASKIEEPARLAGYMRGIAKRLVIGDTRKKARRATNPDSEHIATVADDGAGPYSQVSDAQFARIVRRLLDELPMERDRQVLKMFYLEEIEKTEICKVLEITPAHFNRVIFRAKRRFKELLEKAELKDKLDIVK